MVPRSKAPLSAHVERALGLLAERLRARFGERLRELRVFGSYARGEANEDSDLDVLVLVDGLGPLEIADGATDGWLVGLDTELPISVLPMATERLEELRRGERALAQVLDTEGITL